MPSLAINLDDVRAARTRIHSHVLTTPCIYSERLSAVHGCVLRLKAENLQHIGAFKARGAVNAVMSLGEQQARRGVVTHSSGNHAAAVARAAGLRGIQAHVVMPDNSAKNKIEAVRSYGVEPVFCEPNETAREETAGRIQAETGATLVHPYDNPQVMAGQGTVGLEILDQFEDVDAVIAPVGGGGLISGMLVAIKTLRPEVDVYAAEPHWADDAWRSMESGRIERPRRYDTVADGLRTPLGERNFPIIQSLITGILLVDEQSILSAMRTIVEVGKMVVEPSGAVALAALSTHAQLFVDRRVAIVLSGGNLDMQDCLLGKS